MVMVMAMEMAMVMAMAMVMMMGKRFSHSIYISYRSTASAAATGIIDVACTPKLMMRILPL